MQTGRFLGFTLILLASCPTLTNPLSPPAYAQAVNPNEPLQPRFPEARPFVDVLRAVRDQDVDTFRQAFSSEVAATVESDEDWAAGLAYYTDLVASFCTNPDDFVDVTFMYEPVEGVNNEAELTVIYLGREQFTVSIKREGLRWLINDR